MNFEQFERKAAEVRRIADKALVTNTEMVAAGKVEESSDPLVMFRRGVAHAVSAMILMQEEYEIKTGGGGSPCGQQLTTKTK